MDAAFGDVGRTQEEPRLPVENVCRPPSAEIVSEYGVDPDLTSQFYDSVFASRPDGDYYRQKVAEYGGPVLELGCGTGRMTTVLAELAPVTGIDINQRRVDMLSEILQRTETAHPIQVRTGDMTSFDLGQQFALVVAPFRGFQHLLTPEQQASCFVSIAKHLRAEGVFILDVFNPSVHFLALDNIGTEFHPYDPVVLADGSRVTVSERVVERNLFAQTQVGEEIYTVESPAGIVRRFVDRYETRYSFRYELEHLMRLCGLEPFQVEGGYNGEPFGSVYPGELLISARKA